MNFELWLICAGLLAWLASIFSEVCSWRLVRRQREQLAALQTAQDTLLSRFEHLERSQVETFDRVNKLAAQARTQLAAQNLRGLP